MSPRQLVFTSHVLLNLLSYKYLHFLGCCFYIAFFMQEINLALYVPCTASQVQDAGGGLHGVTIEISGVEAEGSERFSQCLSVCLEVQNTCFLIVGPSEHTEQ